MTLLKDGYGHSRATGEGKKHPSLGIAGLNWPKEIIGFETGLRKLIGKFKKADNEMRSLYAEVISHL